MAFYQVFDAANIVFLGALNGAETLGYYGGCCWGICIGLHSAVCFLAFMLDLRLSVPGWAVWCIS